MAEINRIHTASQQDIWSSLPWETWQDTCSTLYLWTQIVGKIRLKLTPKINHYGLDYLLLTRHRYGIEAATYTPPIKK